MKRYRLPGSDLVVGRRVSRISLEEEGRGGECFWNNEQTCEKELEKKNEKQVWSDYEGSEELPRKFVSCPICLGTQLQGSNTTGFITGVEVLISPYNLLQTKASECSVFTSEARFQNKDLWLFTTFIYFPVLLCDT